MTVYPGDTLYSLAFAYGCTPEELQRCNPGHRLSTRRLPVGVQLRLPKDGPVAPWNRLDARLYGGREEQLSRCSSGLPLLPIAVGFAVAAGVGTAHVSPEFNKRALHVAQGAVKVGQEVAHHTRQLAVHLAGHVAAFFQRVVVVSEVKAPHAAAPVTSASALRAELARAKAETAAAKAIAAAADARADLLARELDTALAQVEELTHAEQTQRQLAEAVQSRVHELAKQLNAVRHAAGDDDEADA